MVYMELLHWQRKSFGYESLAHTKEKNKMRMGTSMSKIICISGKRGSGKTMLARFLQFYGYEINSLASDFVKPIIPALDAA